MAGKAQSCRGWVCFSGMAHISLKIRIIMPEKDQMRHAITLHIS